MRFQAEVNQGPGGLQTQQATAEHGPSFCVGAVSPYLLKVFQRAVHKDAAFVDPIQGRNPRTGQPVPVPAKRLPFFKVGKELKELVNNSRHMAITGGPDESPDA